MSGYAIAHLEEIDELTDGREPWRPIRHHFGITSFGINAWTGKEAGERIINEHVPGWYEPVTIATIVVGLLALIAALILLALPASNEFFRRRPEPEPPTPGYPPVG